MAGWLRILFCIFFFSSRRRHTRFDCDWSSDVCSSDLRRVVHKSASDYGLVSESIGEGRERHIDRKSVVWGKSVDLGGRRIIKKKNKINRWTFLECEVTMQRIT